MSSDTTTTELTDGFHLVIDALKCNDIDTIFGLVGIPITDLARLAQGVGGQFVQGEVDDRHAEGAASEAMSESERAAA